MTTQKAGEAHETSLRFRPGTVATGLDHGAPGAGAVGDAVVALSGVVVAVVALEPDPPCPHERGEQSAPHHRHHQ